jgi:hypothetical protein
MLLGVRRIALLVCLAALASGTAMARPAPRVGGGLYVAHFTLQSGHVAVVSDVRRWTIAPRCDSRPCAFDVVSRPLRAPGPVRRFHFRYARGVWTSRSRATIACPDTRAGYRWAGTFRLSVQSITSDGHVIVLTGGSTEHVVPTAAGIDAGCPPDTLRYRISVGLVVGFDVR